MDSRVGHPLDVKLNDAVLKICDYYVPFYIVGDGAPSTYRKLKEHLDAGKTLIVAHEGSGSTIFASTTVNFAFRAWHDWCHWKGKNDFSQVGESSTCSMQIAQLNAHYGVNRETQRWASYLVADIVGQRRYYEKYKEYVVDQKAFALAYVGDNEEALGRKW